MLWLLACASPGDSSVPGLTCDAGAAAVVDGVGYAEVGEAVADAPTGGRVDVCAGTWPANVVIEKEVSIVGDGAVLDGGGAGSVLWVKADASVSGLTITGGTGSDTDLSYYPPVGGGILLESGTLTLEDVKLSGNTARMGAGAYVAAGAWLEATGVVFSANEVTLGGAGVEMDGGTFACHGCLFEGNSGQWGGGIAGYDALVTLDELTEIRDNEVVQAGGGLLLFGGGLALNGVTIDGNRVTGTEEGDGGGGMVIDLCTVDATSTLVTANEAAVGGGVYTAFGGAVLSGLSIEGNRANQGGGIAGGELWGEAPAYLTLRDVRLAGNEAVEGGGLYISNVGPPSSMEGGGLAENTATTGGGAFVASGGSVTFVGVEFAANEPEDVSADGTPYEDLGADADLACGEGGCE